MNEMEDDGEQLVEGLSSESKSDEFDLVEVENG
jgi:hypothetical protein